MGVFFSIFNHCNEVKHEFDESVIVKSISFGHEGGKTPVRSVSFKGRDSEPLILKSSDSGEMILEGSVSFKKREFETKATVDALTPRPHSPLSPILDPNNPKHAAAIKLQKVYKSFRTRRKLADCAVLVEQSWWKLLDFAELKRSSISFFDIEKHETAVSRWSRARTRAAKVGKGLSKNDKAQKLALQHWLEAIDPRHRYGHNLHLYYDKWLHSQSQQPFFYWLDIGEGKEINLLDMCPRSKLQQQCIKYLGPKERQAYEVIVEDGKFFYKQTGELLNTTGDSKWIFVLSASKTLYIGKKIKGTFQHSSFLAGGATTAAGRLVIEQGVLKAVWPHSGHYRPTEENFKEFISFLRENHVDLTEVKMSPVDDDEYSIKRSSSSHGSHNSAEFDLSQDFNLLEADETEVKDGTLVVSDNEVQQTSSALELPKSPLELRDETEPNTLVSSDDLEVKTPDRRVAEDSHVESIPRETILQRINSKKGSNSYQLGKQLSCKWTTGAGPRIGCVRDYPTELQFQALEQVNLSPRGENEHKLLCFSPRSTSCLSPRLEIRRSTSEELHWPTSPMFKKQNSLRRRIQSNLHSPRFREAPVAATLANA